MQIQPPPTSSSGFSKISYTHKSSLKKRLFLFGSQKLWFDPCDNCSHLLSFAVWLLTESCVQSFLNCNWQPFMRREFRKQKCKSERDMVLYWHRYTHSHSTSNSWVFISKLYNSIHKRQILQKKNHLSVCLGWRSCAVFNTQHSGSVVECVLCNLSARPFLTNTLNFTALLLSAPSRSIEMKQFSPERRNVPLRRQTLTKGN